MIIYVNGDSHSAGAEAVNPYCFAEDDRLYSSLGRKPHPDNLQASYGCLVANMLGAILDCDAESASSTDRIIRTTQSYLESNTPDLIIIGWSTWEREEWLHDNTYYQITAGTTGWDWPKPLQEKFKTWVIEQTEPDVINQKFINNYNKIYELHKFITDKGIPHLFFNTFSDFGHLQHLKHLGAESLDFGNSYLNPYSQDDSYYFWLKNQGFVTVNPKSYHYGADAHRAWADYLLPHVQRLLTTKS